MTANVLRTKANNLRIVTQKVWGWLPSPTARLPQVAAVAALAGVNTDPGVR